VQVTESYHWLRGAGGLGLRDPTSREGKLGKVLASQDFALTGNTLVTVWDSLVYIKATKTEDLRGPSSLPHAIDLVLLLEYIAYKLWLHFSLLIPFRLWNNPQLTKAYPEVPLPQQVLVRIP